MQRGNAFAIMQSFAIDVFLKPETATKPHFFKLLYQAGVDVTEWNPPMCYSEHVEIGLFPHIPDLAFGKLLR